MDFDRIRRDIIINSQYMRCMVYGWFNQVCVYVRDTCHLLKNL